jgi:fatty-acyl-CoA synthase
MTAGGPRNLLSELEAVAETDLGFFFHGEDATTELRYVEVLERARERTGALAAWGVEPGDTVGILGPNGPEWVIWAFATWARGATVVPIPFGMRVTDLAAYIQRLRRAVEAAGCRVVIADPRFLLAFPDGVAHAWDAPLPTIDPSAGVAAGERDVAVLQFTSGTTAEPKMAELSHGAVLSCIDGFVGAIQVGDDVVLSWLPFFHDNGLFAHLVGPVTARISSRIVPTERFARNPGLWLKIASDVRATLTSGPTSAWAVALRSALRGSDAIDLSSLRTGAFGAEAIDPSVIDRFEEHAGRLGLRPGTLVGAYGLAEATLVVSIGSPRDGTRIDRVSSEQLAGRGEAVPVAEDGPGVRRVASCGRPTRAYQVRIAGPDGPVPERHVGEIQVLGAGAMTGYRGLPADEQPFTGDGWLRTGDAGYLAEGELFVTGRIKDLIIVLGRNYAPEEFEWEAQQVTGVRAGRAVAFAADEGGEGRAIVVFEPSPDADAGETAAAVRRRISERLGVAVGDVVPVAKGSVLKTTSGKLRRAALRDRYTQGELERADGSGNGGG